MTITLAARPIETRLRPLYATGFIHGFALWYSIEKLFYLATRALADRLKDGRTVLGIALTRYLHDAMPSNIRAGASSVVSTIGYGAFIPTALGFGLLSRAHGIFESSVFVAGALGVMCLTLSVILTRRQ